MSDGVLRYAAAERAALLVDDRGRAVWPVASDRDFDGLADAAALHGLAMEEVRATVGTSRPSRDGSVVAYGLEDREIVRLYAHLTNRRACSAETLAAIPADARVILTTTRLLSPELFRRLAEISPSSTCGVIHGGSEPKLLEIAKARAASLLETTPPALKRSFVYGTADFALTRTDDEVFVGGEGRVEDVRAALGSGAGIATVLAHADGIHVTVTQRVMLCPFRALHEGAHGRPQCLELGRCLRYPTTPAIDEMWARGLAFSPSDVRARTLIMHGCNILRLSDPTLTWEWTMASALAETASCAAVVSIYQDAASNDTAVHGLVNALSEGEPIGSAIAAYNASRFGRESGADFVLIGDPDYAPAPLGTRALPAAQPRITRHTRPFIEDETVASDLLFLRRCLAQTVKKSFFTSPEQIERASLALADCDALLYESGATQEQFDGAVADLQTALLDLFVNLQLFADFWAGLGRLASVDRTGACPHCGSHVTSWLYSFAFRGHGQRIVVSCPRCGELENAPVSMRLRLNAGALARGLLRIDGLAPHARASVSIIPRLEPLTSGATWPSQNGVAAGSFDLTSIRIPTGPLRLRVHVMHGLKVSSLGIKARYDREAATFFGAFDDAFGTEGRQSRAENAADVVTTSFLRLQRPDSIKEE